MYKRKKVAVVIPAFNEQAHIASVVKTIPKYVDFTIVVDDASTDATNAVAKKAAGKKLGKKIFVLRHEKNQGVGGAIVTGHKKALALGVDFVVVMAGDGQMPPQYASALLDALCEGCDYAKGNRFLGKGALRGMPALRVLGNAMLTFLTKAASGYWHVFDPQNGFTAIRASTLRSLDLDSLAKGYVFENDLLVKLNIISARVRDVAIPAQYGSEKSGIKLWKFVPSAAWHLKKSFLRRIYEKYVLRDFHPIALFLFGGAALSTVGFLTGLWILWEKFAHSLSPSVGSVLLCLLPLVVGIQLLLTALILDVYETPR
ncbi:MAG: glycosyltransferase family 2 protein [Candidatus Norongarragalinales archaeon]